MLEDALNAYPGTVLLVTHDQYLIRSVADALVEVRDGTVVYHPGVDEQVLAPTGATTAAGRASASPAPAAGGGADGGTRRTNKAESSTECRGAPGPQGPTKELKSTVQRLERQIAKLEASAARWPDNSRTRRSTTTTRRSVSWPQPMRPQNRRWVRC